MSMQHAIEKFATQFSYEPVIQNADKLRPWKRVVLCGMGGSHLNADAYQWFRPHAPIRQHRDYGLPALPTKEKNETLIIASSYSGNTEEIVQSAHDAFEQGYNLIISCAGGKLQEFAKEHQIPYIAIPSTGIQPRTALGYTTLAFTHIMGDQGLTAELRGLQNSINHSAYQNTAQKLAKALRNKVPVIYASRKNRTMAENWKIKMNENVKIPAFFNVIPEANHNEMTSFDRNKNTETLSDNLAFVMIYDKTDHPRNTKRMDVCGDLYHKQGLQVERFDVSGATGAERLFSTTLVADWIGIYLAQYYGVDDEQVPMVEDFKKKIA